MRKSAIISDVSANITDCDGSNKCQRKTLCIFREQNNEDGAAIDNQKFIGTLFFITSAPAAAKHNSSHALSLSTSLPVSTLFDNVVPAKLPQLIRIYANAVFCLMESESYGFITNKVYSVETHLQRNRYNKRIVASDVNNVAYP